MRNIKLIIEYDGSNYLGWQRQPQGLTIQEVLENALEKITKEKTVVIGSGRTDSGVHALAQVANFKTQSAITTTRLQKAVNSFIPKDIVIKSAEDVALNFHAQFDAKSKVYTYKILNRHYHSALERQRAWLIPDNLNLVQMQNASELLRGEHDFRGFALSRLGAKTTVRKVLNVSLQERAGSVLEFEIESTGFLKGMVRLIVGTLVHVGKEKITPDDFGKVIQSGVKTHFVRSAPPCGLYLKEVKY